MMKTKQILMTGAGVLLCTLSSQSLAAIALDRTRVVVEGGQKSVSLTVSNENKQLPYLAQGWIEDARGNKISGPMTVLPLCNALNQVQKARCVFRRYPISICSLRIGKRFTTLTCGNSS